MRLLLEYSGSCHGQEASKVPVIQVATVNLPREEQREMEIRGKDRYPVQLSLVPG